MNKNTNKKNTFKRFLITNYIELCAATVFSFFNLSFHADISLLAFPLSLIFTGILAYFFFFKIKKQTNGKFYIPVLKMTSYLPYVLLVVFIIRRAGKNGTPYWYDLITVFLWIVIFVCALMISRMMNEKRSKQLTENWEIQPSFKKPKGIFRFFYEIVDWVDAIVWALCTVMLVQIFIFQLYTIPSESMVPTFLIKDRVAVSKIDCGPKFPLTDIGLPNFRKYKRGDTIVLRNPHYTIDRKSEVKSVASQLIYMLTLMQVNLNRDENGEPKADPLVKRITGLPGEQLVMQDGVLYTRTKNSDEWIPSKMDEKYACWDLSSIKSDLYQNVQTYPLALINEQYNQLGQRTNTKEIVSSSKEGYSKMLEIEQERRNYDLNIAMYNAKNLVEKLKTIVSLPDSPQNFTEPSLQIYQMFANNNLQNLTKQILTQKGGIEWFENFMTSWISSKDNVLDMYEESNFKLNVMSKICFGNMIVRYAELIRNSVSSSLWNSDSILLENMIKANNLVWYVQFLLDSRNMKVFPACDKNGNPQYIPENCYFMMGDNRFNSLDLRHSDDYFVTTLTSADSMSFTYQSILEPQYINKKYIIGKPIFRFWPLSRIARIR